VTAGCLGGTGGGDPTATTTDTTTNQPTTTEDGPLAPGVTREEVNVTTLLDAHESALRENGFEVRMNYTREGDDGRQQYTRAAVAEAGLHRLRMNATRQLRGAETDIDYWTNATMTVVRTTDGYETTYRTRERQQSGSRTIPDVADTDGLRDLLDGNALSVESTDRAADAVTLVATDFDGGSDQFGERSAELVVSGDGVVLSATVEGALADGGSFEYTYEVPRVGVEDAERPAWVDDAPAPVAADVNVGFEGCEDTYLRLDNGGPDALPAGSVVEVTINGTTHSVTLEEAVDPEGTQYLYLTTEGEFVASAEEPSAEEVTSVGNEVSLSVVTGDGLVLTRGSMGFGCESASTDERSSGGSASSSNPTGSSSGSA